MIPATASFAPHVDFAPIAALGLNLRRDVNLARLTTMKVGGPAEYFVAVNTTAEMIQLVRWARAAGLAYFVLGGGSNILISDAGIRGLVIHNRCRAVRIDPAPCCVFPLDERPYLFAESGAPTAGVARTSINAGLTGFEWAISVPGTIGGAVLGNAGAFGGEVKDSFEYGYLIDETGEVRQFDNGEMAYSYRTSTLKCGRPLQSAFKPVILSANFRLTEVEGGVAEELKRRADEHLRQRRQTQPVEPSLGSTFVNPPGDYAGRLIESAGLKGTHEGSILVSMQHANFMINPGGAGSGSAREVLTLMRRVQQTVEAHAGVRLIPEVQFAGEWGDQLAGLLEEVREPNE